MTHRLAGVAKDQGAGRVEEAQQIDDGALDPVLRRADGAIFDVGMAAGFAARLDAQSVTLIMPGQGDNGFGKGGREQERAALRRRGFQDEFQVLAKAPGRASRRLRPAPRP